MTEYKIIMLDGTSVHDFLCAKHETHVVGWWSRGVTINRCGPAQFPSPTTFYWCWLGTSMLVARNLCGLFREMGKRTITQEIVSELIKAEDQIPPTERSP